LVPRFLGFEGPIAKLGLAGGGLGFGGAKSLEQVEIPKQVAA
jgi:hypothetical protein